MRISFSDYFISFRQLIAGERVLAGEHTRDLLPDIDLSQPQRVLDLANGRLRPQSEQLRADGHHVVGIDLINRPQPVGPDEIAYRLARWLYRSRVSGMTGRADRLICGDVGVLPFPNDYFDEVTSIAAFEHFLNVPAVVVEVQRVLRPPAWLTFAFIRLRVCLVGTTSISWRFRCATCRTA